MLTVLAAPLHSLPSFVSRGFGHWAYQSDCGLLQPQYSFIFHHRRQHPPSVSITTAFRFSKTRRNWWPERAAAMARACACSISSAPLPAPIVETLPVLPAHMLRSLARVPSRACSLVKAAGCPLALASRPQPLRAAFASQPPQQSGSRGSSVPQNQRQQQQRAPGQIVSPPGAAAPPPLPAVIEVTPESAEAVFSSSRSCSNATGSGLKRRIYSNATGLGLKRRIYSNATGLGFGV